MIEIKPYPHVDFLGEEFGEFKGSPVISRTRVPVARLFAWHRRGTTIDTLMKRYPQLKPAAILAALAFAYDNEEIVRLDMTTRHMEAP